MSSHAIHLLHLALAAAFLYFLAFTFDRGGPSWAFVLFLVAGGVAELGFWVQLFRRKDPAA